MGMNRLPHGMEPVEGCGARPGTCCACGGEEDSRDDQLLQCDSCRQFVHMGCYGVSQSPNGGLWLCDLCQLGNKYLQLAAEAQAGLCVCVCVCVRARARVCTCASLLSLFLLLLHASCCCQFAPLSMLAAVGSMAGSSLAHHNHVNLKLSESNLPVPFVTKVPWLVTCNYDCNLFTFPLRFVMLW
jgi:PHD-finger